MTYIDSSEEAILDTTNSILLQRGDRQFDINPNNLICWGEIDYDDDDDLEIIDNMNLLNHLAFCGELVPANYDYVSNTILDDNKIPKYIDTTRIELVMRFKHGLLGKPKRTVVFKQTTFRR